MNVPVSSGMAETIRTRVVHIIKFPSLEHTILPGINIENYNEAR